MADVSGRVAANWNDEDAYWRENYRSRPYGQGAYDDWQPAYRFGYESATRYSGREWNDVERDLEREWDTYEGRADNRSTWQQVKDATRDAWNRVTGKY